MSSVNFKETTARFPATVLGEAKQRQANGGMSLDDRFTLLGVTTVLDSGFSRTTRTAEIAKTCGVTEATLYKKVPKPLIETMAARALHSLREDFFIPRYNALTDIAARLAINDGVDFSTAIGVWSEAYGAIANPAAIYKAVLPLPQNTRNLMIEHADMITRNVKLLGLRSGTHIDDRLGVRVLPVIAAYDMTEGMTELGVFTEQTLLDTLESVQ